MHVAAVTVCVNFADFLADTLPVNRPHFDQYVVVTSPEDAATQRLAKRHDCTLVITERFREDGAFNKGRAINDGLDAADARQWVCHLDADIVLPLLFRLWLKNVRRLVRDPQHLRQTLLSLHRVCCTSREEWLRFRKTGTHDWPVEKLRRWNQVPAGYLQIWHASMPVRYPETSPTAGGSDLEFGRQFVYRFTCEHPRVIHLETKKQTSADYAGRRSAKWREL